ncbi:hypothetical protein D3C75_825430 [compost metagenome]
MLSDELVMASGRKIGGVDFGIQRLDFSIQPGSVTVPDGIRAPALHQFLGLFYKPFFTWQGYSSFRLGHRVLSLLLMI